MCQTETCFSAWFRHIHTHISFMLSSFVSGLFRPLIWFRWDAVSLGLKKTWRKMYNTHWSFHPDVWRPSQWTALTGRLIYPSYICVWTLPCLMSVLEQFCNGSVANPHHTWWYEYINTGSLIPPPSYTKLGKHLNFNVNNVLLHLFFQLMLEKPNLFTPPQ